MKRGVVAFLDALGTKGIWSKEKPEETIAQWENFLGFLDSHARRAKQASNGTISCYEIAAFSDTVIVILDGKNTDKLLIEMARLLSPPFLQALLKGIYIRGVISVGGYHVGSKMFIGPAIQEASEWYEKSDWIGISTAPTATFTIEKLKDEGKDLAQFYVKYRVPPFQEESWALNWPRLIPKKNGKKGEPTTRTLILAKFASRPIETFAISKYNNTMAFFDQITGTC